MTRWSDIVIDVGGKKISKDLDETLDAIFADAEIDFDWDDMCDPEKEEEPDTQKVVMEFIKCPECKGSGQYIGLGVFPPDKCHNCLGAGKVLKD